MRVADSIRFWLNDEPVEVTDVAGTTTLLRWLRERAHLTGTKEGCGEGDCGACTVAMVDSGDDGRPTFRAVNSCLLFLPMLQGRRLYTVEGLARSGALHPAQSALVETRGSQCGYCTPGIVMSLFEATYRRGLQDWQIDDQLAGNLCRCTGYRPIREAGKRVAGACPSDPFSEALAATEDGPRALRYEGRSPVHGSQRYLQPTELSELFAMRASHPDAPVVAGGTDLGLDVTKRHRHFPVVIGLEGLSHLEAIEHEQGGWRVGARVPLTVVMDVVGAEIAGLHKMLRVFGARQIRNRATLGGNLATASPIGDMAPALAALGAEVSLVGSSGRRSLLLDDFFEGYRQTALREDEILESVWIPRPAGAYDTFKVSKRRELDISTVAAGMYAELRDGLIVALRIRFGGVAAVPAARAVKTEAALLGRPNTEQEIRRVLPLLDVDFSPIDDLRGTAQYRAALVRNLVFGFFGAVRQSRVASFEPWPTSTLSGGLS